MAVCSAQLTAILPAMQSDGQTADAVTQTATDTLAEFKGHCIAYSLQGNINAYISGEKLV